MVKILVPTMNCWPTQEKKFNDILKSENIQSLQLYNYDEIKLYLWAILDITLALKVKKNTFVRNISKDRVSALLCANADESSILKSVIIGKSKKNVQ